MKKGLLTAALLLVPAQTPGIDEAIKASEALSQSAELILLASNWQIMCVQNGKTTPAATWVDANSALDQAVAHQRAGNAAWHQQRWSTVHAEATKASQRATEAQRLFAQCYNH